MMAQIRKSETEDQDEYSPAPDMAETLHLSSEESLTGPFAADPNDAGWVPPDRPVAARDHGVTPAEQRAGETLDSRLRREIPEDAVVEDPNRSGRLEAADTAPDGWPATDDAARDVGPAGGAASAEEAAVHELDNSVDPVVDDDPVGDPEVTASLEEDLNPREAEVDAAVDVRNDPEFGDAADADLAPGDAASRIDGLPEAGGAAAAADGRTDAGPGAFGR
jgi:hypothetical protein